MKLNELNNYYFHDSSITELIKKDGNVNLKIDYCLFMQDDYVEGTEENCILELSFKNATSNMEIVKENTILNTNISDNSIAFNLEIDETSEIVQLIINADTVEITKY